MSYVLHAVELSDIEALVRYCDHPAMQENPLNMTMFPNSSPETKEEEIMWHVSSFRESFHKTPGTSFLKACTNDRTPVGFALWTLDQPCPHIQSDREESKAETVEIPGSLDIHAWRAISQKLTSERRRVLQDLTNVWRLNVLSVSPTHQRQGCGSMLLAWGCEQADRYQRTSFVMASPAAVGFYERFGYEPVGQVVTTRGTFSSMLRQPKRIEC
ncbi:acyl-CoA N-acyltransferase [Amniculicola lignicola CBS 123094]|uniref:Acyl-CoA N-acyltransferase n=1 Tax=Amniculicola lignicola CBS 123094 TaxID=1392246 RepID=A0A6A5W3I8_9PLEO|nr:acyl-CoA N-acyltransferase [Amniculicola lignicola CBS 123094]